MMKTVISILATSVLMLTATVANAESIGSFINKNNATGTFNCSYKGSKASSKCQVKLYKAPTNLADLKQVYGRQSLPHMSIKWPDGDISKFVFMDSTEVRSVTDNENYSIKTRDDYNYDLRRGFVLENQNTGREHVRLW